MPSDKPMSFQAVQQFLEGLEAELPPAYLAGLNGGILLLDQTLRSEHDRRGNLYILGMYHYEPRGMGRYITLYYGTFVLIYGQKPLAEQQKALREVLMHELQHHLESLAGDRSLEREDQAFLRAYDAGESVDRHG